MLSILTILAGSGYLYGRSIVYEHRYLGRHQEKVTIGVDYDSDKGPVHLSDKSDGDLYCVEVPPNKKLTLTFWTATSRYSPYVVEGRPKLPARAPDDVYLYRDSPEGLTPNDTAGRATKSALEVEGKAVRTRGEMSVHMWHVELAWHRAAGRAAQSVRQAVDDYRKSDQYRDLVRKYSGKAMVQDRETGWSEAVGRAVDINSKTAGSADDESLLSLLVRAEEGFEGIDPSIRGEAMQAWSRTSADPKTSPLASYMLRTARNPDDELARPALVALSRRRVEEAINGIVIPNLTKAETADPRLVVNALVAVKEANLSELLPLVDDIANRGIPDNPVRAELVRIARVVARGDAEQDQSSELVTTWSKAVYDEGRMMGEVDYKSHLGSSAAPTGDPTNQPWHTIYFNDFVGGSPSAIKIVYPGKPEHGYFQIFCVRGVPPGREVRPGKPPLKEWGFDEFARANELVVRMRSDEPGEPIAIALRGVGKGLTFQPWTEDPLDFEYKDFVFSLSTKQAREQLRNLNLVFQINFDGEEARTVYISKILFRRREPKGKGR